MVYVFVMIPVLVSIEPKFVQSVVLGVASSSIIEIAFPIMFISGEFTVAVTAVLEEVQEALVVST
jgi:hypothetical protein